MKRFSLSPQLRRKEVIEREKNPDRDHLWHNRDRPRMIPSAYNDVHSWQNDIWRHPHNETDCSDSHVILLFKLCVTIDDIMMMLLNQWAPSGKESVFCTQWEKNATTVTHRDLMSQGQQMWSRFWHDCLSMLSDLFSFFHFFSNSEITLHLLPQTKCFLHWSHTVNSNNVNQPKVVLLFLPGLSRFSMSQTD